MLLLATLSAVVTMKYSGNHAVLWNRNSYHEILYGAEVVTMQSSTEQKWSP